MACVINTDITSFIAEPSVKAEVAYDDDGNADGVSFFSPVSTVDFLIKGDKTYRRLFVDGKEPTEKLMDYSALPLKVREIFDARTKEEIERKYATPFFPAA